MNQLDNAYEKPKAAAPVKKKEQGRFVLETWEIVLIIVGSVFVLGTATFLSVFLYKRKKKPLK